MSVLFLVAASSTAGEFGPACSTLTVVLRDLFGAMLRNFNKLQLKIGLLAYSPLGKPGRDSVHDMQLEFTGSWSSLEKSFER